MHEPTTHHDEHDDRKATMVFSPEFIVTDRAIVGIVPGAAVGASSAPASGLVPREDPLLRRHSPAARARKRDPDHGNVPRARRAGPRSAPGREARHAHAIARPVRVLRASADQPTGGGTGAGQGPAGRATSRLPCVCRRARDRRWPLGCRHDARSRRGVSVVAAAGARTDRVRVAWLRARGLGGSARARVHRASP